MILTLFSWLMGFPGGAHGKEPACQCRRCERGIPWVRHIPWKEGIGNPLPCSCLENPCGQRSLQATVHGVTKSRTRLKRLSMHAGNGNLKNVNRYNNFSCVVKDFYTTSYLLKNLLTHLTWLYCLETQILFSTHHSLLKFIEII